MDYSQEPASLRLRQTTGADLPFVVQLERAAENAPFIGSWSEEQHGAALEDADTAHLIIEAEPGSAGSDPLGYVILTGLAGPDASICLKRLVVAHKGQGHGRAALRLVKALAFEKYGAHRLWLDVKDFNTRARRLYESEHFVFEGVLRECLKAGDAYQSLVVMSILEQEWQQPGDAVNRM